MTTIKLTESYAINSLRNDVRDALLMAGEWAVLLQLYHPEVDKDVSGRGQRPRPRAGMVQLVHRPVFDRWADTPVQASRLTI